MKTVFSRGNVGQVDDGLLFNVNPALIKIFKIVPVIAALLMPVVQGGNVQA